LYSLLGIPIVYTFSQWVFAHNKKTKNAWRALMIDHEVKIVLDVGCGLGKDSIYFINSKKYIGIDISQFYINSSKKITQTMENFIVCQ